MKHSHGLWYFNIYLSQQGDIRVLKYKIYIIGRLNIVIFYKYSLFKQEHLKFYISINFFKLLLRWRMLIVIKKTM